ncbi:hypothetical protein SNE40_003323 [Patella caerulea]|uniref:Uncharacterized protein n=1 Tax=Patella caerulea TaxID=87958 RepID=A0AAN8KG39_PATCE
MLTVINTVVFMLLTMTLTGWSYPLFDVTDIPQNNDLSQYQHTNSKAKLTKRGHPDVDVWQLCPQRMAQADCFYTYLRVYARLRKGARNVEPVSMRNIGKRRTTKSPTAIKRSTTGAKDDITVNCPDYLENIECYYQTLVYAKKMIQLYKESNS